MRRCVTEDSNYAAIQVTGYVSLTVNSSHISGRYYGIKVVALYRIPGRVSVENSEIRGGTYGIWCSGTSTDCRVVNSHLQSITCQKVRSCTVERCVMNSSDSNQQIINANSVQTLVIDSNIIANNTSEQSDQTVRVSHCNAVQARSFLPFSS